MNILFIDYTFFKKGVVKNNKSEFNITKILKFIENHSNKFGRIVMLKGNAQLELDDITFLNAISKFADINGTPTNLISFNPKINNGIKSESAIDAGLMLAILSELSKGESATLISGDADFLGLIYSATLEQKNRLFITNFNTSTVSTSRDFIDVADRQGCNIIDFPSSELMSILFTDKTFTSTISGYSKPDYKIIKDEASGEFTDYINFKKLQVFLKFDYVVRNGGDKSGVSFKLQDFFPVINNKTTLDNWKTTNQKFSFQLENIVIPSINGKTPEWVCTNVKLI